MPETRHHRPFAALGLVAMLLLALLPTIGRMAGVPEHGAHVATPGHASHVDATAMHGAAMGAMHDAMAHHGMHHAMPAAPAPVPHPRSPPSPHSGDCDYCPLLAALATLAIPALAPGPAQLPPPAPAARIAARFDTVSIAGLGARGPPTHLA